MIDFFDYAAYTTRKITLALFACDRVPALARSRVVTEADFICSLYQSIAFRKMTPLITPNKYLPCQFVLIVALLMICQEADAILISH